MLRRTPGALARVAVLLSGCGVYDGSEIHEATSALIHLDAKGHKYSVFAPKGQTMHVVNHQVGQPAEGETRDMMVEAARIARGAVGDVAELKPEDFDALIIPGGFGVMKNLSDFAVKGALGTVRPDVSSAIKGFHGAGKPIGAACIAPVLVAAVLGECAITMGSANGDAQDLCRSMGANVVECDPQGAVVDPGNKVATTPAYMADVGPAVVFHSVGAMIDAVDKLL